MPQKPQADHHQHRPMQIDSLPMWDHWQYFSKLAHNGHEADSWNNQLVSWQLLFAASSRFENHKCLGKPIVFGSDLP